MRSVCSSVVYVDLDRPDTVLFAPFSGCLLSCLAFITSTRNHDGVCSLFDPSGLLLLILALPCPSLLCIFVFLRSHDRSCPLGPCPPGHVEVCVPARQRLQCGTAISNSVPGLPRRFRRELLTRLRRQVCNCAHSGCSLSDNAYGADRPA